MPQTTKKKKPATTKKKSTASAKKPAAPEKKPIRREVFGAILAVLGVLTFIGYFSGEAFLVSGVCAVVKGLIGFGYWVFPPMLLIAAWGLLLHHGKPVALRTTAALMVPVFTGAFADIFHPINLSKQTEIFKTLYESGKELSCGGVLGGLISYGLSSAITSVAAGILLFLLLLLCMLGAFNLKPSGVVAWFKNRERPEYEPEEDEDEEAPVKKPKQKKPAPAEIPKDEEPKPAPAPKCRKSAIDIPLDDDFDKPEEEFTSEKTSVFGSKIPPVGTRHTENVKPVSIEEAEAIAGVSSAVTLSGSGKTAAAEINDPPKKLAKEEIAAETAAIAGEIAAKGDPDEYEKPPIYLLKKGHAVSASSEEELRLNKDRLAS